jgi:hypothetical protein
MNGIVFQSPWKHCHNVMMVRNNSLHTYLNDDLRFECATVLRNEEMFRVSYLAAGPSRPEP